MKQKFLFLAFVFSIFAGSVLAQEKVDLSMIQKIKLEGTQNTQVMEILFYLTDVYGPRLSGSPNLNAARNWCIETMTEWGLENAALESWGTFGRGWSLEKFSCEMKEPDYMPLIAYPKAWIDGTEGPVSGKPVLLDIRSEDDFEKYKGKLKETIVLLGIPREAETHFEADARRYTNEDLENIARAPELEGRPQWAGRGGYFARYQLLRKAGEFLREEGAAVVLEPSRGEHGTIFVSRGGSHDINAEPAVPGVVMAIEHYSRIVRLLEKEIPVELSINIKTKFHVEDSIGYNVIAEIPGTDKNLKDEVVMLGGHIDSWHAGTGSSDNAAGCAVSMEALRILKALDVKPRRTIRIALWDAEEQGFMGSGGYVEKHFGNRRTMELKPEHKNLFAYFNFDNGTGKIRGIYCQGNDAVRPVFEAWLEPFHDMGATTVSIRNTSGTDHLSFDRIGLPGFQFIQDPIDYSTRVHHTNMDVYDHSLEGDLMQASIIIASFVYHAAMRDEKLPRKTLPELRRGRTRF